MLVFNSSPVYSAYGAYIELIWNDVNNSIQNTYFEKTNDLTINISYPLTDSEPVNRIIHKMVMDDVQSFKLANGNKGVLDIQFKQYVYNDYIVGFVFDNYEYVKKEGNSVSKKTLMFDLFGGNQITIDDLFTCDKYIDVIRDYTNALATEEINANINTTEAVKNAVSDLGKNKFGRYVFDSQYFYVFLELSDGVISEVKIPLNSFEDIFIADSYLLRYYKSDEQALTGNDLIHDEGESVLPKSDTEIKSDKENNIKENNIRENNKSNENILNQDPITSPTGKYIALTFDDGPHRKNTPQILDALSEYNAKATFFVLGHRIELMSDIIKRMVDEGHCIGNHTYNHKELTLLSKSDIEKQINSTNDLIYEITDQKPTILRPPYGLKNQAVIDISREKEMAIITWNLDPEDWKETSASTAIYNYIINKVKDGDIILLHDIFDPTVEGTIMTLKELTEQGYTFVTIPQLISIKYGEMNAGSIYRDGCGTVDK